MSIEPAVYSCCRLRSRSRGVKRNLWFPRIRNSKNRESLQRFHLALDDEDFLLLQLLLQPFFESRQEPSHFVCIGRKHAVDDNGITISRRIFRQGRRAHSQAMRSPV